jgi:uncharacterized protein
MVPIKSPIKLARWQALPLTIGTIGLLAFNLATPALAQEKNMPRVLNDRVLSVSGHGVESIATTLTRVNLGVEVQGKTANEVQEAVARKSTAVVTLLKSRGVEKLQTAGINLNPTYDYTNNRQILTGYTGTNAVTFRIKTDEAGTIIDDAVKAGASRIDGVSFTATESAIATAQKAALRKATEDAQAQAQAVLTALGFQQKEIVGIQINAASAPPRIMQTMQLAKSAISADASTPVVGGEQQVEGNVTLQISY